MSIATSDEMQIRSMVTLELSQLPEARALAAVHGVEVVEVRRRGVEPLATTVIILMGTAGAVGAVRRLMDERRGGQVIDLRPGAARELYRTPDVQYGLVVILAPDGTATVEVREPDGMFGKVIAALPQLISGDVSGVDLISERIADSFGREVQVRIERTESEESE
jgi:hypothetical protein